MELNFTKNGYVKFIRGTQQAFNALTTKDNDTLYFITNADNPSTGSLYLGSKLIGGSGTGSGAVTLGDLTDVVAAVAGNDNYLLVYDEDAGVWKPQSFESIISTFAGTGNDNKFLRGDGTWATPTIQADTHIFTTTASNVLTLKGFTDANNNSFAIKDSTGNLAWVDKADIFNDLNAVKRRILTSYEDLEELVEDESYDSNTIYLVRNENSDTGNLYDEYMVITGAVERIGSGITGDLSSYLTTAIYEAEVGNLSNLILSQSNGTTIVDQLNDLTERMSWCEIELIDDTE